MKNYKKINNKSVLCVIIITLSIAVFTPAIAQYINNLSKPPIVDGNNGIMNLKLIGDGVASGGTAPNSFFEQFNEVQITHRIPNYDYNVADINILPQYYAKDTIISGPLTITGTSHNLALDWENNQYISNIEAPISSAEYRTKRSYNHIKHALTWEGVGWPNNYNRLYHYNCEIPKFQDNNVLTSGSKAVTSYATVPGIGDFTYAQTAVELGTEILDYEWDWGWDLNEIELWYTIRPAISYGFWPIECITASNKGASYFQIEILAKRAWGGEYSIPLLFHYSEAPIFPTEIPGYINKVDAEPWGGRKTYAYNYHLKTVINDINLGDINRYSQSKNWYASQGNPVITIRLIATSSSSWIWDNVKSGLDIRECSMKYTFKSDSSDERKLSDPSDFYISSPYQENLVLPRDERLGWANRAALNSANKHLRLGIDLYNTYDQIIINLDYVKVRYYKFNPTTKCQLNSNGDSTTRYSSSWVQSINDLQQTQLYSAQGTFALVDLSVLSLTYEAWDTGWEYTDSIVFAYSIDFVEIFLEDIIAYYDGHGEYLYDLGFWQRDIIINWKEVQLEGVYIEELFVNGLPQNPSRIFLDYHNENIEIWKTTQPISCTWPIGSSYESITLEFNTIIGYNNPPVITITSPSDGLITNQDVTLLYTVSDDFSSPEDIVISGPASGTTYTSEEHHIILIAAIDEGGKIGTASVSFIIDRTAPEITITGSSEGYHNTDQTVFWSVTDPNLDVDSITASYPTRTTFDTDGPYQVTVSASDLAGNFNSKSLSFTIDKTAPEITITGSVEGYHNTDQTVFWSVADLNLDSDSIVSNFPTGTIFDTDGTYQVTVSASDLARNFNSKSLSFTIDETAPLITISGPSTGYYNADQTVSWSVTDLHLDDIICSHESPTTFADEGSYQVTVSAYDLAGNSASASSAWFVIDKTLPETLIYFGDTNFIINDNVHLTSTTPIELLPSDLSGVSGTFFMVSNDTFDSGWIPYTGIFSLNSLDFYDIDLYDGDYVLHYYSTDIAGNSEVAKLKLIVLDSSPPELSWGYEGFAFQDGIQFDIEALDATEVMGVTVSIREFNGPVVAEIPVEHVCGNLWQAIDLFDSTTVPDGYYELVVDANDAFGFTTTEAFRFSIRNWAVLVLLPSTESNNPGRTMPVKFALRVIVAVDPSMPFVVNQELEIFIIDTATDEILQRSTYGDSSTNYRINELTELYITNFKTHKTPTTYLVNIYRYDFFIGEFSFATVPK